MVPTRVRRHVNALRESVCRALTDTIAITRWKVRSGMTWQLREFDVCQGGT